MSLSSYTKVEAGDNPLITYEPACFLYMMLAHVFNFV